MPTPTPARAMVARPAPISLAEVASMEISPSGLSEAGMSVMQMQSVVQIDAGQDREDIGLQEGDQELEARERDDEGQRRPAGENPEGDDEDGEDLQHGMAGHHVGEEPDREADRAGEVADDLDDDDQRQQEDRDAGRHEQLEKAHAVADEADDRDAQEDHDRHGEGDDDVAEIGR